jgi:predicted O-methyltransferase YrrM
MVTNQAAGAVRHIIGTVIRRARRSFFFRLIRLCQTQPEWHQIPPRPPRPTAEVQQALSLPSADLQEPKESPTLAEQLRYNQPQAGLPTSRDLFFFEGTPLPCWQESDLTLNDDWLSADNYYPTYYAMFHTLATPGRKTRLLEIGVRTGYMGVVFARAARGASHYLGIDPNLYLHNGLQLASATFKLLRSRLRDFEFTLLEGYSWDSDIQRSLIYSGPFDIIHIDGDHTLVGKLLDLALARHLVAQDGVIMVDDYDQHSIVSNAIKRAMALGWYKEFAYIPTKRGLAVLQP